MADPIEFITQHWDFISQLIILGVGAGIAVLLVPYFTNKYQEKQLWIDRQREDRKFELEIKDRVIGHVTQHSSWCFIKIREMNNSKTEEQRDKIHSDVLNQTLKNSFQVTDLILLYFENNQELQDADARLSNMITNAITISASTIEPDRKKRINDFLKTFNLTLTKEEIEKSSSPGSHYFSPGILISGESGAFTRKIYAAKIKLPNSKSEHIS